MSTVDEARTSSTRRRLGARAAAAAVAVAALAFPAAPAHGLGFSAQGGVVGDDIELSTTADLDRLGTYTASGTCVNCCTDCEYYNHSESLV